MIAKQTIEVAPFRDAGVWNVEITVSPTHITIIHKKNQRAVSPDPEEQFTFDWELCMILSPKATEMRNVFVTIPSLQFAETTSEAKRRDVESAFRTVY